MSDKKPTQQEIDQETKYRAAQVQVLSRMNVPKSRIDEWIVKAVYLRRRLNSK